MRTLWSLLALVSASWLLAQSPYPPTRVSVPGQNLPLGEVVKTLSKQSGLPIDISSAEASKLVPLSVNNLPFFEALQEAARGSGHRIIPTKKGTALKLVPTSDTQPPQSVDGPFRFAVRQVASRHDFDTGLVVTELNLDLHWEPRYPVFRIESEPRLTTLKTDGGQMLNFSPNRTKIPTTGSLHQPLIRIANVPRAVKSLNLSGEYVVTAAEKMLSLEFSLDKLPTQQTVEGVAVKLTRAEKVDNRVEVQLDLEYPKEHPEFESFETYVPQNVAKLQGQGLQSDAWLPSDFEISSNGRRVVAVYRFVATGKPMKWNPIDWRLHYTTPGPLKEFPIKFHFPVVPLP